MELVSEKFPRMFFFSPLLDFIFLLLLPFFFSTMFAIVISRKGEGKRSLLLFFANIIVRDTFFLEIVWKNCKEKDWNPFFERMKKDDDKFGHNYSVQCKYYSGGRGGNV